MKRNIKTFVLCTLAQLGYSSSDCSERFSYHGCAVVDLSALGNPLVFSDSTLSPEACQKACQGHQVAALFPDCCRCGDHLDAVRLVSENVCNFVCMGDPSLGTCGSTCEPNVTTVYTSSSPRDDFPPWPADSGPLPPPGSPSTSHQGQYLPPFHAEPPNGVEPANTGDQKTPEYPPGRGVPPEPKFVSPGADSMGTGGPEESSLGPELGIPSPEVEINSQQGSPPEPDNQAGQSTDVPVLEGQWPPNPGSPGQINPPWVPGFPTSSEPEPQSPGPKSRPPGEQPIPDAPGPLNPSPPNMGDSNPPSASTPQGTDPSNSEPQPGNNSPTRNGRNTTDGQSPPGAMPWPNPSSGMITEGGPPSPSLVTGSDARNLDIPIAIGCGALSAIALIFS